MSEIEKIYEVIDDQFNAMTRDHFNNNPLNDPLPQEGRTPGQVEPAGWVENADAATGGATVVIDADGITVTDGAIVVSNASSTVIIDGSSNMFKIAATGTQTKAWPTSGFPVQEIATTTVTALGSGYTVPPSALFSATADVSAIYNHRSSGDGMVTSAGSYVADYNSGIYIISGQVTVALGVRATLSVGLTAGQRYYVLQEAAI